MSGRLSATNENLWTYAHKPLMRWLVQEALVRSTITYGKAADRLEREENFASIFPIRMGWAVGSLMDRLADIDPKAPLINVIMVSQTTKLPSSGAGEHFARRYQMPKLTADDAQTRFPKEWRSAFEMAAKDVYAYQPHQWADLFQQAFGEPLSLNAEFEREAAENRGSEKDGLPRGRHGEGPNHKALRLWVEANPGLVHRSYVDARALTEVDLKSGDRVDVVYYCGDRTVVIEIKSRDSNTDDLRRGIYQCVKYRAVQTAMDVRGVPDELGIPREQDGPVVEPLLVTEKPLPGEIADLLRLYRIKHILVPMDRS